MHDYKVTSTFRILRSLPLLVLILFILFVSINYPMHAQTKSTEPLDVKQQSIVTISALTTTGDIPKLKQALNAGLEAGLTINEIKEVLVQLYAYCGFPRSLNGINALMSVVDQRKAAGKNDSLGKDASPIVPTANKYTVGQKMLEVLMGKPDKTAQSGANAFAPVIDTFLKEHLFADIFSRDVLTYRQRELVTISSLASMAGVESQLQFHLGAGLQVGLSESQLKAMISLIETSVGKQQANTVQQVLTKVLDARKPTK
ncbi:carboxymuconolactone decarboxylase family protein [Spirosoma endbachense]|uniref:Carboxymuconolactone decarboxylase n=1 Tax=Spirosoma endbachense TaxID=2666025 RepID=A0A6P1W8S0_9BACT|nr:carboxymuconolactone decarboxylase family protein [Spirosoma endbachense]QHW00420.1 carboxymuconolactone decarboxylase [Spirosoma endbachense]